MSQQTQRAVSSSVHRIVQKSENRWMHSVSNPTLDTNRKIERQRRQKLNGILQLLGVCIPFVQHAQLHSRDAGTRCALFQTCGTNDRVRQLTFDGDHIIRILANSIHDTVSIIRLRSNNIRSHAVFRSDSDRRLPHGTPRLNTCYLHHSYVC